MRYNLCGINGKFSRDNAGAEALSPRGDKVPVLPERPTRRLPELNNGDLSAGEVLSHFSHG